MEWRFFLYTTDIYRHCFQNCLFLLRSSSSPAFFAEVRHIAFQLHGLRIHNLHPVILLKLSLLTALTPVSAVSTAATFTVSAATAITVTSSTTAAGISATATAVTSSATVSAAITVASSATVTITCRIISFI